MKFHLILLSLLISFNSFSQGPDKASGGKKYGPEHMVFVVVEKMPEFPGGKEALNRFLNDNLNYPTENDSGNLKKGIVYMSFLVEQSGKIMEVKLLKGLNQYFDQEAIRVIKLMPNWIPGKQSGVIVKVRYTLPIKYEKPK